MADRFPNMQITDEPTYKSEKGSANGIPSLDGASKIPTAQLPAASETATGAAEIATQAETDTGTDDERIITPLKLNNLAGVRGFFLDPKGSFGTGGGWVDEGIIENVPVLLYSGISTEKAIFMFFGAAFVVLTDVDPEIIFIPWSTTAPSLGNEDVELQLTCRYIAVGESAAKTPDQVLTLTSTLSAFTANTAQAPVFFVLDRSLIEVGDVLNFVLERLPGDVLDTYNGNDLGIGQSGARLETTLFNP